MKKATQEFNLGGVFTSELAQRHWALGRRTDPVGKRNNTTLLKCRQYGSGRKFFFAPLGSDFGLNGLLTGH